MNQRHYLEQTLQQASLNRGSCSPNPAVGAVIVNQAGEIIARGSHRGPGTAHAEVDAIRQLDEIPLAATTYVTLEPCCHFGRTPPCTDAIIKAGIKKVIYAYRDPNPLVAGKGENALREAGVECEHHPIPEIDAFYESYTYWHQTRKPFITAKLAITLDGKIAGPTGELIKITGEVANHYTHQQRKCYDAILTTSKTIIVDNPQLNVRIDEQVIAKPIYILDRQLKLPLSATIFSTAKSLTVFYAANANTEKLNALQSLAVKCIPINVNDGKLDLNQIIGVIGNHGVQDLWVEAGGELFAELHHQRLLRKSLIYIAPHALVSGKVAFNKEIDFRCASAINYKQLGNDILCEMRWPCLQEL